MVKFCKDKPSIRISVSTSAVGAHFKVLRLTHCMLQRPLDGFRVRKALAYCTSDSPHCKAPHFGQSNRNWIFIWSLFSSFTHHIMAVVNTAGCCRLFRTPLCRMHRLTSTGSLFSYLIFRLAMHFFQMLFVLLDSRLFVWVSFALFSSFHVQYFRHYYSYMNM